MSLLDFDTFSKLFADKVTHLRISWDVLGFYAPNGRIYPFGTDTKVLSTVFESLVEPIIISIAQEYDYTIQRAEQTIYPDFTLTPKNEKKNHIAIDIKTTYRRFKKNGQMREFRYTLGSYTSFLRVPGAKKNILYPYQEYTDHWVIGFLYTRRERATLQPFYHLDDTAHLPCPYQMEKIFVTIIGGFIHEKAVNERILQYKNFLSGGDRNTPNKPTFAL